MENKLSLNQLTIVIGEMISEEKEPDIFAVPDKPEEQFELEKRYYRYFYIMLQF